MNARPSPFEIQRRALKAAATVVLAMNATGCWLVADDSGEPVGADTATGTTALTTPTTGTDAETGETAPVDTAPALPAEPDCSVIPVDECCTEWMDYCDDFFSAKTDDWMDCVYGKDFDGSTGCIPWGPPVPPRMRGLA